jgi:hypothetical protein
LQLILQGIVLGSVTKKLRYSVPASKKWVIHIVWF